MAQIANQHGAPMLSCSDNDLLDVRFVFSNACPANETLLVVMDDVAATRADVGAIQSLSMTSDNRRP